MKLSPAARKWHRNRGARSRIARVLIGGPDWLLHPIKVANPGYLESVLKVVLFPPEISKAASSYSVFVDQTTNRHRGFLKPVVRIAHWHRPEDYSLKGTRRWPKVDISYHTLRQPEQRRLHLLLRNLDLAFSQLQFLVAGLITDRSEPVGCSPKRDLPAPRHMNIVRSNNCQHIEFGLDEYAGLNEEIELAANKISKYLDQLCLKPDSRPYLENYSKNLNLEHVGYTDWVYTPRRATAPPNKRL
jgi:hypothetical protein